MTDGRADVRTCASLILTRRIGRGERVGLRCGVRKRRHSPKWADGSLRCSFCGKTGSEAGRLIAGPGVYICNDCVGLCNEILEEEQTPAK